MKYLDLRNQIKFERKECEKIPKEYSIDKLIKFDNKLMPIDQLFGLEENEIEEYDLFAKNIELSNSYRIDPEHYTVIDGNLTINGRLVIHTYIQSVFLIIGNLNVTELVVHGSAILIVKGNTNVDNVIINLYDAGVVWFSKKLNSKNLIYRYGLIIGVENKKIDLDDNLSEFPEYEELIDKLNMNYSFLKE